MSSTRGNCRRVPQPREAWPRCSRRTAVIKCRRGDFRRGRRRGVAGDAAILVDPLTSGRSPRALQPPTIDRAPSPPRSARRRA